MNEEMIPCLCSTEIAVVVKRVMFDHIRMKKLREDNTWNEEGVVSFHSRTKSYSRPGTEGRN